MCFTVTIGAGIQEAIERFTGALWDTRVPFPEYDKINAMARPVLPVVTMQEPNRLQPFRWLLIPPWITSADKLSTLKIWGANARIEELEMKRLYRPLVETNRCIVTISGFYEWRHEDKKTKTMYVLRMPQDKPMALPGLYRTGEIEGKPYSSCTICTMEARGIMRYIHNSTLRQPVVVDGATAAVWLDQSTPFEDARNAVIAAESSPVFVPNPPVSGAHLTPDDPTNAASRPDPAW